MTDLSDVARRLLAPGKGILAADESTASADKRLALYGIAGSEENRRAFRDLFLNAPGVEKYLSGVILYTETLTQKGSDKKLFPKSLSSRGIIPGIKVDEGTEPFPESPDELITKGVLGLCDRLIGFHKEYDTGFTKWRAVIRIDGDRLPTAQHSWRMRDDLLPMRVTRRKYPWCLIVEPEVLYEGNHSRLRAREVIETTMHTFSTRSKTMRWISRASYSRPRWCFPEATVDAPIRQKKLANETIDALMASVPRGLAGIVFLSGGQTPTKRPRISVLFRK
jgi:fructose-bisphosphate aldolase class I